MPRTAFDQIVHRGGLTRVGRGVYRFDDIPASGRETYLEAVLMVGDDAYLMADAVLALHDLALVNPRRLRVGVPRRARIAPRPMIEVIWKTVPAEDLTIYEGIPCTTVTRALLDCRGIVMRERLIAAANEALARGLVLRTDAPDLLRRLGAIEPVDVRLKRSEMPA